MSRFLSVYLVFAVAALCVLGFWFSGCAFLQNAEQPRACVDAMKEQVLSLKKEGFELRTGKDLITDEGAASVGQFLNIEKEEVVIEAIVDSEALIEKLRVAGFQLDGTCSRGGRDWFVLSLRKKIHIQTN